MTVYLLIAIPLATGIVAWSVGLKPTLWFIGSGKRRFTRASAKDLVEDKRVLEQQLAEARRRKACPNCQYLPGSGMPTAAEVAESDRSDQTRVIDIPAPVDNGVRDTPLAAADTVKDSFLERLAQPGEEHLVATLQAKAAAPAKATVPPDAVTQRFPAVTTVRPLQQRGDEQVEAWARGTAPRPGATAAEVLPETAAVASYKVAVATAVAEREGV